ncbi:MAG: ABC transporter substrate-binding protein [Lachnospiraceae bacterium]|nr:ABC transporter substrate-binding protein [Lachnospiraceae bacterium]
MKLRKMATIAMAAAAVSLSCAGIAGAEELQKVTVAVPHDLECIDDMAIYVGITQGYFEEQGLDVELITAANPTDLQMVATGQADLCCPSPNVYLGQVEAGVECTTVSAYDAINIFGFSALNGKGIETWEDLKGKTIALGDAAWETIALPTLLAAGIDPEKDVEFVVCGDSRYQMVAEGQVDVLFTWVSEYKQLLGMGYDFNYIDGNDILATFANPWIAGTGYYEENQDKIQKFLYAMEKSIYFMYTNPEAAADTVLTVFPGIEITWEGAVGCAEGRVAQALGNDEAAREGKFTEGLGALSAEQWKEVIDGALAAKVITDDTITYEQCYTDTCLPTPLTEEDIADVKADVEAYEFASEIYKSAN